MFEEKFVKEALSNVFDPSTGQDIMTLGLVKQISFDGNNINLTIHIAQNNSELKSDMNFACIAAIQDVYPNANVNIHIAVDSSNDKTSPLPQVKNIIVVASGKGGVGKSTVSVNIALALKQLGVSVGLMDADLYGPSIPTMLGLQGQRPKIQDLYGKPRIVPLDANGIPVLSIGFLVEPEQAVVLRGPRLGGIIKQFISDTNWPVLDYLIIDLPPGTGDIQLTLVQTVPVTGAILVTTPQEVAVVDAVKAMNMFMLPQVNVPILGVVENMSWFTPAELPDNKYYIFGEGGGARIAKDANSIVLGQIPLIQGVREGGDKGTPIVQAGGKSAEIFLEIASKLILQTEIRNERLAPTQIIQMQQ
ncbi:MAG: Mrp/NBP35 family ATP-binding protein [Saprospiraceae bacterium]|nr:Mrp/NBP35 family ATP-binding protein [Saprospiraceae bacterium]